MAIRNLVRLNGTLGAAAQERWSCGFNFGGGAVITGTEINTAVSDVMDAVEVAWSLTAVGTLRTLLSAQGALTSVDLYSYAGAGPASVGATANPSTTLIGTFTATCPPQVSAVASLLTGMAGQSMRGRVYWPAIGGGINTSFQSTDAGAMGPGLIALVQQIEDALAPYDGGTWGVYSPTLEVVTPVTSVRAGNILDTQRRRRDALVETYTVSQVP